MFKTEISEYQKLKKECEFLKKIIQEVPASIHINKVDKEGNNMPVWVNGKYEKLIGYSLEERQKKGFINSKSGIYYEDDAKHIAAAIRTILEYRSREESIVFRFYRKDGEKRWVLVRSKAITYKGDPNHFISVAFDVTDHLVLNQDHLEAYINEIAQLKNELIICKLTPAEKEIIKEICKGYTTRQIAAKRNRSYETINNHKRNIFKKLNVHSCRELMKFSIDAGIA